jgi:hypothetical protein
MSAKSFKNVLEIFWFNDFHTLEPMVTPHIEPETKATETIETSTTMSPGVVSGKKCNIKPEYCQRHVATGYEMFPTNSDGFCDKTPITTEQFCSSLMFYSKVPSF